MASDEERVDHTRQNEESDLADSQMDVQHTLLNIQQTLCTYNEAEDFCEGLSLVIDQYDTDTMTEQILIPLFRNHAWPFNEGLAVVKKDEKYGFIDKTGKIVIPLIYDKAWSFNEGLAVVQKDWKYGFIDKTGMEAIPLIYDTAWSFNEGLARVEMDWKYGFIDKTDMEVIPIIYDKAGPSMRAWRRSRRMENMALSTRRVWR